MRSRPAEFELQQVNRLLRTISAVNAMIVRQTSIEGLLSEVCRIFVEIGGFAVAWVGLCQEGEKRIRPVAAAGTTLDSLQEVVVRYDESPEGQGPSGRAVRDNSLVLCPDLAADPLAAPWQEQIQARDLRSCASAPIRVDEKIRGVLSVCARGPHAVGAEEASLLEKLAADLGFAIGAFEDAAALRASEDHYRHLIETAAEGIIILDAKRRISYANAEFSSLLGYPADALTGKSYDLLLAPEDVPTLAERWDQRRGGAVGRLETRLRSQSGASHWVLVSSQPVFDEGGQFAGALVMVTDIHQRKLAEERARRTLSRLRQTVDAAVMTLARAVEIRDPYTASHQERVTELAVAIGERLGLRPRTMTSLRIAALIHDLGKIAIPAEILAKPGKLTETERQLVQAHPQRGYEILREMRFPGPVATIVRQHHERIDGSGYPQALEGKRIRIEARIVAVADVVEAMSSHRPYRAALGINAALAEVEANNGTLYDPDVVAACLVLFRQQRFRFTHQP